MVLYSVNVVRGKRVIIWNKNRSRGLKEAKDRIGDIAQIARQLLKKKNKIKVLEVGCGYGKLLLDLKRVFGERVDVVGINVEKRWNQGLVRRFVLAHKLFSKKSIDKNLPKIIIADAGMKFPFSSNYFDLVISQSCIQYVHDKVNFLEEINRVLTPRGIAHTDFQDNTGDQPIEYQHLFEIWDGKKRIPVQKLLKKYGLIIKKAKLRKEGYIIMKKMNTFRLPLKLVGVINTHEINKEWWGNKSVYVIQK
ncbi:MAG: class I SAM-dependent methyltransferase [Nanoarchaeota archaeon]|nr:class I SAM-dependent methyltransferase [Nanoarchaeota archaeon]